MPNIVLKHPGGRPSKYNNVILNKAQQYIETYDSLDIGHKIPSVAGLAVYLQVHKDTIYEWCKHHAEFSDSVKSMMCQQEAVLLGNGLDGTFNAHITKLVLSKHGYGDNSNKNNSITVTINRDCTHIASDSKDSLTIEHED